MLTSVGAQITFSLSSAAHVQARILNIAGRRVRTLCRARDCEAGTNTLMWNATSDRGLHVPSGRYIIELRAESSTGALNRSIASLQLRR